MIIEKIHIYGFGKWNNVQFDLHPTLNQIKGPNESGKTSLKHFILYVLFGLTQNTRKLYEPKEGSRLGGRLVLKTPDKGQVIVERIADKRKGKAACFLEDGREEGEEYLHLLLKGMDLHTYKSIFAFDDQDLQKLRSLTSDDLGKVLFGVGLSGSDKITKLENNLNKELEARFKKNGKIPVINEQLQRMKDVKKKIQELEEREHQYNKLKSEVNRLLEEIKEKKEELSSKKIRQQTLEKYFRAKDAIQQFHFLEEKLHHATSVNYFPHMGLERYQQLKEFILPVESQINALRKKESTLKEKLEHLKLNLLNDELYEELERVDKQYNDFQITESKASDTRNELDQLTVTLEHEKTLLGLDKEVKDLTAYHFSIYVEEKWKSLTRELEHLKLEEERLNEENKRIIEEEKYVKENQKQLENKFLSTNEYHYLKEQVEQYRETKWKEQFILEQRFKQEANHKTVEKMVNQLNKVSKASILIGLIGSISTFLYAYFKETYLGYLLGGGILFLGIFISQIIKMNAKAMKKQIPLNLGAERNNREQLSLEQLQQIQLKLSIHEEAENKWKDYERKMEDIHIGQVDIKKSQLVLSSKREQLDDRIAEQQEAYPFLTHIELEHWPAFFHKVVKLQKDEGKIKEIQGLHHQLIEKCNSLKSHAIELASKLISEDEISENVWNDLGRIRKIEVQKRSDILHIHKDKLDCEEELKELYNKLEPYIDEVKQLFHLAKVEKEEQFIQNGKEYEEKQNLLLRQEEWYQQVKLLFPHQANSIVKEDIDWDGLEIEMRNIHEKIEDIHHDLDKQRQDLADRNAEISQLEENEQLSELRHHYVTLKSVLKDQVKKWVTLKAADTFIKKTKKIYQNEYLPEIIERATYYFQKLTLGRYLRIFPPTDVESFQVERHDHVRFDVSELSTGTTAQAYVSLRLALSEVMNSSYGLPFLIDDAFVHYDEWRRDEMLRILMHFCSNQQVIYFTNNEQNDNVDRKIHEVLLNNQTISAM